MLRPNRTAAPQLAVDDPDKDDDDRDLLEAAVRVSLAAWDSLARLTRAEQDRLHQLVVELTIALRTAVDEDEPVDVEAVISRACAEDIWPKLGDYSLDLAWHIAWRAMAVEPLVFGGRESTCDLAFSADALTKAASEVRRSYRGYV